MAAAMNSPAPALPWVILMGLGLGAVIIIVITLATPVRPRHRLRKLQSRPPARVHRCRLPWRNPFRRLGARVQCSTCGETWRWDRFYLAPGAYERRWISEAEEAERLAVERAAEQGYH